MSHDVGRIIKVSRRVGSVFRSCRGVERGVNFSRNWGAEAEYGA